MQSSLFYLGSLEDDHIVKLCQQITSRADLMELGVNVLRLPGYTVDSAITDNRNSIQEAAHKVLSTWLVRQANKTEAYRSLVTSLRRSNMTLLGNQLVEWVQGHAQISTHRHDLLGTYTICQTKDTSSIHSLYKSPCL